MQTELTLWIFVLLATALYALAVIAELAFPAAQGLAMRARPARAQEEAGTAKAAGVSSGLKQLLADPVQFLMVTMVFKTVALVLLGVAMARLLPVALGAWETLGVGALLALLVLLGNAALRGWTLVRAAGLTLRLTAVMGVLLRLVAPLAWLLRSVARRTGNEADDVTLPDDVLLSENGLRLLMNMGGDENPILEDEKEMIASILEMDDTAAREVMVPRMDMVTLPADVTMNEALDVILEAGHSRIPVYENNVDQIVGILYAKDFLRCFRDNRREETIRNLLRPAYFVPLSKKVNVLLRDLQKQRVHIAMVVDEYGGIAGLVTIEDIIEEIVGDIQDEYDRGEDIYVEMVGPDAYLLNSRLDLYSVAKLLDVEVDDEDADTLGGMIYSILGHVPAQGEQVEIADWLFTVLSVDGNRIDQIRAERKIPAMMTEEDEATDAVTNTGTDTNTDSNTDSNTDTNTPATADDPDGPQAKSTDEDSGEAADEMEPDEMEPDEMEPDEMGPDEMGEERAHAHSSNGAYGVRADKSSARQER